MTIVALWYRTQYDALWCASDTRVSGPDATITDSAAKILPIPVLSHRLEPPQRAEVAFRYSLGFAYAGSHLAANTAHSLLSACTQSLLAEAEQDARVAVRAVAELARQIGERTIKDMSIGRIKRPFEAFIFGYCPVEDGFRAFKILPSMADGSFRMDLQEALILPNSYYLLGSGSDEFLKLDAVLAKTHRDPGVLTTLSELIRLKIHQEVGGRVQIGVATREGFQLLPVIEAGEGAGKRSVSFLGFDLATGLRVGGLRVGFRAAGIGLPEQVPKT